MARVSVWTNSYGAHLQACISGSISHAIGSHCEQKRGALHQNPRRATRGPMGQHHGCPCGENLGLVSWSIRDMILLCAARSEHFTPRFVGDEASLVSLTHSDIWGATVAV